MNECLTREVSEKEIRRAVFQMGLLKHLAQTVILSSSFRVIGS
ncbi:unnamed protein product [Rhodiola kirilowii]